MITSRKLSDLHPKVHLMAETFLEECRRQSIDVLIYCTYRDAEAQNKLYDIGRRLPGKTVTDAKGGQSMHNYRLAFDWVPLIHGKPAWNDKVLYLICGEVAESIGLEWAGRWKRRKETAHCQWTGGLSLEDLQAGKMP